MKNDITVKFSWIPSHVGIRGNERADSEARAGLLKEEPVHVKIPYTDYIPVARKYIMNEWQNEWNRCKDDRLGEIMPILCPFYTNSLNRRDEVVIQRIRIGHTRLTQSYKMEDPLKRRPQCPFCNLDEIAVKHLLIECPHFTTIRLNYYSVQNMRDLFESVPFRSIIGFLKEARLYELI